MHNYTLKLYITAVSLCNLCFIHLFSVNLLQDMEIVTSIIIQEKKQQHTVYTYKICEKFVSVCVSNMQ